MTTQAIGLILSHPAGPAEHALNRVWDAIAAAGADDHVDIAEHPDIPRHWRREGGSGGDIPRVG